MSGRVALALTLALLCSAQAAEAQERALAEAVSIANGDGCILGDAVVGAATEWLGRERVDGRVAVLVDVAPDGSRASVIAIRDGEQVAVRRFDPLPASCADRLTVVSLGVALAIDALLLDVLERTPPPTVGPASPPLEPAPAAPAPEVLAVELAGEGGLSIDTLSGLAGLGGVAVGLVLPPLVRLRIGALASSPVSFALGTGSAETSLVAGRADVCLVARALPLELDGCVGALAGAVLARGHDYASVRSVAQPWIGVAPRIEAALWVLEPLALTLAVDGLFSFVPPTFEVAGADGAILYARTLPVASLSVSAGLRVRFR